MRTLTRAAVRRALPDFALNRARGLRSTLENHAADRGSPLLFAFPGGAGSREGMGRQLYATEPAFRVSVDACSQVAEERLGFAATPVFRGDVSMDAEADFQIAWRNKTVLLGIVQIALCDLLQAAGVAADGVLGLSLGDITAAYPAGALSREDTMAVVCSIAPRTSARPKKGEIFVVSLDIDAAKSLAHAAPTTLEFLGELGPQLAMLIGGAEDAKANREFLTSSVDIAQTLETDWSYHTMLAPFDRQEILDDLQGITPNPIRLPYYSSVVGGLVGEGAILDGSHWYWLVSRPFYYGSALTAALRDGYRTIVNVGPHPVMNETIRKTAAAIEAPVHLVDPMRADEPELVTWRSANGRLRGRFPHGKRRRRPRAIADEPTDALIRRLEVEDPTFLRDPYSCLGRLREAAPVHYLPRRRCWLVVGFEAVHSALTNAVEYSSGDMATVEPALVGADGEAHLMTRRVLARPFSADATRDADAYAEQAADQLLSSLVGRSEFDVVREVSIPLSALVAGRLLELDEVSLSRLGIHLAGPPRPTGVEMAAARPMIESLIAGIPLYAHLRRHGYEHDVAVGLITLLWVGATSTTISGISSAVLRLADHSARREVTSRPELLLHFVAESLRLEPPVHVITRRTVRDVVLAGVKIPTNSALLLMPGAANRDPAHFADPDRFVMQRANGRDHLAFSAGPHHCLGARLARLEIKAALAALLRLMPDFQLVQPPHTIRHLGSATRTLEQLIISPGGRPAARRSDPAPAARPGT